MREKVKEKGWGGGGGVGKETVSSFSPSRSFFLARPFALAPLGLKEMETTSTQLTSSRKRPVNP